MRSLRRHAALLLTTLLLAACSQWQGRVEGPREVLTDPDTRHVRLTRTNSQQIEMRVAAIQGDSVYGTRGGTGPLSCIEAGPLCNVGIPLSEVGFVEVRRFSPIRTAAVAAIPLGVFFLIFIDEPPCSPLSGDGC